MNQIKIYDVAGAAGVSLATVSRVLNHPEKVKPATKEKIERIIKELGYKPNLNAKGLASSKSTTVAVVVPRLNRSSVAEMVNGIADCETRRGYLLRLFINDSSPTDEEALALEKETLGNVMASGVDGVLYVNDEITRGSFDLLANLNIPVVLTNTNGAEKGLPYVTIDYRAAAYDVTKQMIAKGSKEIWFVTTKRKYIVNELKIEGYTQAMNEAGLEAKIYRAHGTAEINEDEFRNMLNSNHPDVAIVVRDSMAVSFMNIVAEKVEFTVDIRSTNNDYINDITSKIRAALDYETEKMGGSYEIDTKLVITPVYMEQDLLKIMELDCVKSGYKYTILPSGAGHDALEIGQVIPTVMLFVPSKDGRSHCPVEHTEYSEFAKASVIMCGLAENLLAR